MMAEAPPKAGPGASRDAWANYASGLGVEVDAETSRDDIIAVVEAAAGEPPVESEPSVDDTPDEPSVQSEPSPEDEPAPGGVTFETRARRKRVYNSNGTQLLQFVEGRFTTDDEALIAVLDNLDGVRRAD